MSRPRLLRTLTVTPPFARIFAKRSTTASAGRVKEDDYAHPTTMYGCNKLYCEQLGGYYARHYKQLAADAASRRVDFRSVRLGMT